MNEIKNNWNFIGMESSLESLKLRRDCKPGDLVVCDEDKKSYMYDGNDWKSVETDGGLNMPLYEINKGAFGSLPPYKEDKIKELQNKINDWENGNSYFMLLCNDIRYYTVLRNTQHKKAEFSTLGEAVTGLLLERNYTIHFDDIETDYFEVWVKDCVNGEVYMFALFPYDWGVVNYG